jgi:hypothetical protein
MLDALDETLKAVLREMGGLDPDEVDIAFDAPDREWAAKVGKPTVNCYLYDVRENLDLRGTEWSVERRPDGRLAERRKTPRRFDLSYVCTAWTADIEDEHRLLWRVLATMIRCGQIPKQYLQGPLTNIVYPVTTEVAQPDGLLRDPADVWSALDNRIRPSVNVVVTLPLDDFEPLLAPLVLTRTIRIDEFGRTNDIIQIAGTVRDRAGTPLPDVIVRLKDHAYSTVTTADGRFWIVGLSPATYTLVAESPAGSASREVEVPGEEYDLVIDGVAVEAQAGADKPATGRSGRSTRRSR